MCTETPFPCAHQRSLMWLAVLQLRHGRRSGDAAPALSAVDGSDPPFWNARSASRRVGMCTAMPPPARGSLPVHQSLTGRQTGAPEGRVQAGAALAAPTDLAAEAQDATAPADKREVACVYKRRFALLPTVDHVDPESTEADFRICGWRTNDCKNDLTITELQVLRSVTAGTVRRAISRIAPARGPRMCSSWRSLHQPPGYRRPVSRSHRTARACT